MTGVQTCALPISTVLTFVAEPPPATITGDNDICAGESTQLTASPGTSYLWNTGATTQIINVSPTSNTTYSVTVYTDTCSQNASFSVTVLDAPVAGFTFTPDPVCEGQPVNFTGTSVGCGFFPLMFSTWDFGDGGVAILDDNPTHTYSTAGTYNVALTVNQLIGCTCGNTIVIPVTVIPCSPCLITVSTGSTDETCGASDGTATATPSGGTSPYTYLWSDPSSQTTQTATGLPAGTYSVTVTDAVSCDTTVSVAVNVAGGLTIDDSGVSLTDANCGASDGSIVGILVSRSDERRVGNEGRSWW